MATWNNSENNCPPKNIDVLVYERYRIEVKQYYPPDKKRRTIGGFYPGGGQLKGTFWAELPANLIA